MPSSELNHDAPRQGKSVAKEPAMHFPLAAILAFSTVRAAARGASQDEVGAALKAGCDARFVAPLDGAVFPAGFPPARFQWEVFAVRNLIGLPKTGRGESWTLTITGDRGARAVVRVDSRNWTPTAEQWKSWAGQRLTATLSGAGAYPHAALPLRFSIDKHELPDDVLLRYFTPAAGARPYVLNSAVDAHLLHINTRTYERRELFVGRGAQRRCIGCHASNSRGRSMSFIFTNTARKPPLRGAFEMTPSASGWTTRRLPVAGPYAHYSRAGDKLAFSMFRSTTPGETLYYQVTPPGATSGELTDYPVPFEARFVSPSLDIVVFDEKTGAMTPLPGACEPDFVELQPAWSPDGKEVAFVRYRPGEKMDIAVVAYNDGRGGRPRPLAGASGDGWDHYYPEFSPDGRWIAFTRADASGGTFARPDSAVYLVPASGGAPRKLDFNLDGTMNSWHSWSSDGRWMLFSSKRGGVTTKAYVSRIDRDGRASAPVELCCGFAPGSRANMPSWIERGDYPPITEADVERWEQALSSP